MYHVSDKDGLDIGFPIYKCFCLCQELGEDQLLEVTIFLGVALKILELLQCQ